MKKYTIKDITEGKVALINDGNLEQLREVLKKAFPEDKSKLLGDLQYYKICTGLTYLGWVGCTTTTLPTQSVKDFLTPTYPKIMLVSDYSDFSESKERVVLMEKNGKYIAWDGAATFEAAEKTTETNTWNYAKDIDEPTILELTLEQIAEKFQTEVENIKIVEKR